MDKQGGRVEKEKHFLFHTQEVGAKTLFFYISVHIP
jgi:hypothetical protein